MKKIALISDIHGNAAALYAVLKEIAKEGVDQIVCLGDVSIGPQPVDALHLIRDLKCPVVMGNGDGELISTEPIDLGPAEIQQKIRDIVLWCREAPTSADLQIVKKFSATVTVELEDNRKLLCFHGSPRSYNDIIRATTPDTELEPMFHGFHAELFAGGHTHAPLLRRYHSSFLMNPGSIGLPYTVDASTGQIKNLPWSEYALIMSDKTALHVELRRVPFDVKQFVKSTLGSGMPHAEWYAAEWPC